MGTDSKYKIIEKYREPSISWLYYIICSEWKINYKQYFGYVAHRPPDNMEKGQETEIDRQQAKAINSKQLTGQSLHSTI